MSDGTFTRVACAAVAALLVAASFAGVASAATASAAGGAGGAGDAAQTPPETADEFLSAFRSLNGSAAFEAYSEFEVIRTQAVANVQVGEFTAADRERMTLVLNALQSFEAAYRLSQNGSYVRSLAAANRTERYVARLRAAGGQEYVALANLALDRFYRDVGARLNALAARTNRTPEKIQSLRLAATAFERAGAIERFTKLTVRADTLESEFDADMQRYNESIAAARSFLSSCGDSCGSMGSALGLGAFDRYRAAKRAAAAVATAAAIAETHEMPALAERATALRERTGAAVSAAALASAVVALAYALVVGAIAGLLTTRFVVWRRDVEASRVGDIVQAGGVP